MMAQIGAWIFTHIVLVVAKREADKAGVALFSEANALRVRKLFITRVLFWLAKFDRTKRGKELNVDNAAAWFWQVMWKSDTIGAQLGEPSIREARQLLSEAIGEFGKVGSIGAPNGWMAQVRQKIIAAGTILDAKNLTPPEN
jgi:hypothetical protein